MAKNPKFEDTSFNFGANAKPKKKPAKKPGKPKASVRRGKGGGS